MQTAIKDKTDKLVNLSDALLKVGLLVAEGKTDTKSKIAKAKNKIVLDVGNTLILWSTKNT